MRKMENGKLSAGKLGKIFAETSAGALGVLVFVLLSCPNLGNAGALSGSEFTANDVFENESSAVATAESSGMAARSWIKPSLSVALGTSVMDLDVTSEFASNVTSVGVTTNSSSGMTVLVRSNTGTTDLVEMSDSAKRLATINNNATQANFPNSGWGYYVGNSAPNADSLYRPVTVSDAAAYTVDSPSVQTSLKLGVGVKAGAETPIGIYQNTLVVSVIANPTAQTMLGDLTYMQDMTPEICKNTPNYVDINNYARKQLIDMRNGNKKYWVAKLKDGNCWMQENLALNLGFEMTGNDTDITPGAKKTLPETTNATTVPDDNNGLQSRNPSTYPSYWYYQWSTATAGSGTTSTINTNGQAAPDSICPKGWQLPLAGTKYNTITKSGNPDKQLGSGSFYDLLISYGVTTYNTMVSTGMVAPLNFSWIGAMGSGGISYMGQHGYYWSRIVSSGTQAYRLGWYSGNQHFDQSYGDNTRAMAMSVRCVARQTTR